AYTVSGTHTYADQGLHWIAITFTDPTDSLTVEEPAGISPQVLDQTNIEGDDVSLYYSAYSDSESVSYSGTGLPPGVTVDTATGLVFGVISAGAANGSPYQTTLTATAGSLSA